jgi:hypothetical protein
MKRSALENQCISLERLKEEEEFWRKDPSCTIEVLRELSDRRSQIQECILILVVNTFIRFAKGEC